MPVLDNALGRRDPRVRPAACSPRASSRSPSTPCSWLIAAVPARDRARSGPASALDTVDHRAEPDRRRCCTGCSSAGSPRRRSQRRAHPDARPSSSATRSTRSTRSSTPTMLAAELPNAGFERATLDPRVAVPARAARPPPPPTSPSSAGRTAPARRRAGHAGRPRPETLTPHPARTRCAGSVGRMARAPLPRRGRRAPHPQAGRGRPHHHPADPPARAGARGGQGRAAYDVALGLAARAVHPRRPAARRGAQPRRDHPGRDARPVPRAARGSTTSATPPAP